MVCTDWIRASDHRYDMAIVHMPRNHGKSLSETIGGHLPLGLYPDYYSQWSLFCSPLIASSNDNPQMRQVNSVGLGADIGWTSDQPIATRSSVFRAMSGGPWFSNFDPKIQIHSKCWVKTLARANSSISTLSILATSCTPSLTDSKLNLRARALEN